VGGTRRSPYFLCASFSAHTLTFLARSQPERNIADDVIADYEAGLEYASATRIVDRRRGAVTEYLVEVRPTLRALALAAR
jgi:hypothetical protein